MARVNCTSNRENRTIIMTLNRRHDPSGAVTAIVTLPIRTLDCSCGLRVAMDVDAKVGKPFVQ
jgi:hypothetical protein